MSRSDKSLFNKVSTNTSPSFKERYNRNVEFSLEDFAGSWAAQYSLGLGITSNALSQPSFKQKSQSHLGLPGFPEINFRPYDFNTARDKRQPSLLGHPISFEFVGPTSKSSFNDAQWIVTNNSATPNGDVLTLDVINCYSTSGSVQSANFTTIEDLFGITDVPSEGLYLYVSMTGSKTTLYDTISQAGMGDGFIGVDTNPRNAVSPRDSTSKFEIFRVIEVGTDYLTLAPNKRLEDYFVIPGTSPVIRTVCLIKPAVTRLLPLPASSGKVYAIMPPEQNLTCDHLHPYDTWLNGGFTPWDNFDTSFTGLVDNYTDKQSLPIQAPVKKERGYLVGSGTYPYDNFVNTFYVNVNVDSFSAGDVGRLFHISSVDVKGDVGLYHPSDPGSLINDPGLDFILGWFEITSYLAGANPSDPDTLGLKRITTQNPYNGVLMESLGDMFVVRNSSGPSDQIYVDFTVHNKVGDFYTPPPYGYSPSIKDIEETRIPRLVNPSKSRVNLKTFEEGLPYRNYVDKSIFDTSASVYGYADPGSLLDLGFRLVLYPPKLDGLEIVPDFDRPIDSHYIVLDPDSIEDQYIEVDYDSGLIYLSHAINVKEGCGIYEDAEALATATNNIIGGVPLFAACVALSRDNCSQGVKIFGSNPYVSGSTSDYTSSLGSRLVVPLANQSITFPTHPDTVDIALEGSFTPDQIPLTGVVQLVSGKYATDPPVLDSYDIDPLGVFYYTKVDFTGPVVLTLFGGDAGVVIIVDDDNPYSFVFRRDLFLPTTEYGSIGTKIENDVFYGSNQKHDNIYFKNAVLTNQIDGSLVVDINRTGEIEITVGPDSVFTIMRKEMQVQSHFTTLSEAFDHISNLNTLYPNLTFKIRVVGSIEEDATLDIPVNGLIIEGDRSWNGTGGSSISWSFDGGLINLDGKDNIQLKNLNFKWGDSGAASDALMRRYVLYTDGVSQNLLVENCYLNGEDKAHGFFLAEDTLQYSLFNNCLMEKVSDFGFAGNYLGTTFNRCLIDQGGSVEQALSNFSSAFIFNSDTVNVSLNVFIMDCYVSGFSHSVECYECFGVSIVSNTFTSSKLEAMLLTDMNDYSGSFPQSYHSCIKDNKIYDAYTTSATTKDAVLVTNGNDVIFESNWVHINDTGVTSSIYGVNIDSGSNHTIQSNVFYNNGCATTADSCIISNNNVYGGNIVLSSDSNRVSNNYIGLPSGLGGSGYTPGGIYISTGANNLVEGNFIATGFNPLGIGPDYSIYCVASSNSIRQNECLFPLYINGNKCMVSNNRSEGLLVVSNNVLVNNNYFGDAVGVVGTNCLFTGNFVDSTVDATGTNTAFSGNFVTNTVTLTTDTFLGVGNVFKNGVSSGAGDPDSNPYSSVLVANNLGTATGLFGGHPDRHGRTHNVY